MGTNLEAELGAPSGEIEKEDRAGEGETVSDGKLGGTTPNWNSIASQVDPQIKTVKT